MSIVRIGLGETKGFGDGYDAIFKKKKETASTAKPPAAPATAKKPTAKKTAKKK